MRPIEWQVGGIRYLSETVYCRSRYVGAHTGH